MIRVRFVRGTALGGIGNDAYPGDERDLPDPEAMRLVTAGRAVLLTQHLDTPLAPARADADAQTVEGHKPKRRKG